MITTISLLYIASTVFLLTKLLIFRDKNQLLKSEVKNLTTDLEKEQESKEKLRESWEHIRKERSILQEKCYDLESDVNVLKTKLVTTRDNLDKERKTTVKLTRNNRELLNELEKSNHEEEFKRRMNL